MGNTNISGLEINGTEVIGSDGAFSGTVDGTVSGVLSNVTGTSASTMKLSTALATATGATTGTILAGSQFVTVSATDANHIIILPAPVVGTVIWLQNGATGYELRSSAPATVKINGGAEANAESAIAAAILVRAVCTSATTWICSQFIANGTESPVEVAAAA